MGWKHECFILDNGLEGSEEAAFKEEWGEDVCLECRQQMKQAI